MKEALLQDFFGVVQQKTNISPTSNGCKIFEIAKRIACETTLRELKNIVFVLNHIGRSSLLTFENVKKIIANFEWLSDYHYWIDKANFDILELRQAFSLYSRDLLSLLIFLNDAVETKSGSHLLNIAREILTGLLFIKESSGFEIDVYNEMHVYLTEDCCKLLALVSFFAVVFYKYGLYL